MPSIREIAASGFAHEFARKHLETDVTVGAARLMKNLDESLQEAREVLAGVIREHDDPMSDYGCTTHTNERVRALYQRLNREDKT